MGLMYLDPCDILCLDILWLNALGLVFIRFTRKATPSLLPAMLAAV